MFLLVLFLFTVLVPAVRAATPPNTTITNTASVVYTVGGTAVTSTGATSVVTATATPSVALPAAIRFLGLMPALAALPAGAASWQMVQPTACTPASGTPATLAPPTQPGAGALAIPSSQLLASASAYNGRDVAFIEVTDASANADGAVADTVSVTVTSAGGERETLTLTETGPSTGVFLGYIPLVAGAVQAGNCSLQAAANQRLTATYIQSGSSAVVTSVALVDPLGLVFDSATGQPVNGVRVTLIDVATGLPAQVRGNDGVSTYPSSVLTGSTVTDSGGTVYALAPGRYQFPRVVAPGSYRFQVEPAAGYTYPSKVVDATLQALPGAPFVLGDVSRGASFTVLPGPPFEADIPLDPPAVGQLDILKTAGKAIGSVGDFVPYSLALSTTSAAPLAGVRVADRLPPGFRYRAGSARLNDAPLADPQIGADGRSLVFAVGTVASGSPVTLRYVAAIGPSAQVGPAENVAQAVAPLTSNTAKAVVSVVDELNRSRAFLVGRVTLAASCEASERDPTQLRGLPGVRVLLQDGTYVVTDAEGQWHIDNLRPGTHVVQLDTATLPSGWQLRRCDPDSRSGGRDFSQFVNLRGGTLWRADFRLVAVPSCMEQQLRRDGQRLELRLAAPVANDAVSATLMWPAGTQPVPGSVLLDGQPAPGVQVEPEFLALRLPAQPGRWEHRLSVELAQAPVGPVSLSARVQPPGGTAVGLPLLHLEPGAAAAQQCAELPGLPPTAVRSAPVPQPAADARPAAAPAGPQLVEQLPYDDKWLAAAPAGIEWLHPRAGFVPALPAVKVAVKHGRGQGVELRVNGKPVDPLRFEGALLSPNGEVALANWRGVDLRNGSNLLELTVYDDKHEPVFRESRIIHYGVNPAKANLEPQRSKLVADGRSVPVIAVRLLDIEGQPVRRGATGELQLNAPYLTKQQADAIQGDPLSGSLGGRPRYEIGDDGVALIALQPTSQSGEVVLRFDFGDNRTSEVRAWLESDARDWVLVGFAEGTAGHKRLAGNMEALQDAGADAQLFDRDRLAFYAKGMVKGEYLLTAAYDSAKEQGPSSRNALRQVIDPNRYYTLYGDATQAHADGASLRKLYLKIEKKQFYALFGDFDTGLTVTELGRYSRTLNGLKSEFKGERVGYNAFASRTTQAYLKDEIQGDGTSGLYRLRARGLLLNSEKLRIEVRDRFQPTRVLSSRDLTPYLDYQIDVDAGTILLRSPLATRDTDFNPVFLVAEYETVDGEAGWTYGGRAALQVTGRTEVGITRIHEGTVGREGNLTAADATVRIDDATRMKLELATSTAQSATGAQSGNAYLAEVVHDNGITALRAHARQQEPGFGLGQQAVVAQGQRDAGAQARLRLTDRLELQGQVLRQEDLATGASRQLVEGRAQWQVDEQLRVSAGARTAAETDAKGVEGETRQLTAGASYEALERKLVLRASTDIDAGSSGTVNYPNRLALGADYRVAPGTTLTAVQEFARGRELSANTSRVGLRTELWRGAELLGGVGNETVMDAGRLYASLGLVQKVKLDERWTADAALDQTRTLRGGVVNPLGVNQPLASGSNSTQPSATASSSGYNLVSDGTAVSVGLAYRDDRWSGNSRIEWRGSDTESKLNLLLGVQRRLDRGEAVAAGLALSTVRGGANDGSKATARVSYAWRPDNSDWIWLDRLEYTQESSPSLATRLLVRKLVNNLNANWKPNRRTQVALQYGAKFVRETLQDQTASGYTDLIGAEARYDVTEKWDIGVHAGMLHAWSTHSVSQHLGLSVGYRMATNTWVSVGYNSLGFDDKDFAGAEYRARGVYVNMRVKFDQDTFDLNDRAKGQLPLK
ncbi:hypothetical protein GON04_12730 [Ramlibacter sp. MAH-25]|uniref:DUF11 domain-containing protein n=1 Tax=Ramlibacter pinisoli TaxID=2682844 RepID=A0A6N8IW31_9BURK|nr:hypothetical protein [Ramlibacter pinisoli]